MKCTQNNQAISLPLLPGGAAVVRSGRLSSTSVKSVFCALLDVFCLFSPMIVMMMTMTRGDGRREGLGWEKRRGWAMPFTIVARVIWKKSGKWEIIQTRSCAGFVHDVRVLAWQEANATLYCGNVMCDVSYWGVGVKGYAVEMSRSEINSTTRMN